MIFELIQLTNLYFLQLKVRRLFSSLLKFRFYRYWLGIRAASQSRDKSEVRWSACGRLCPRSYQAARRQGKLVLYHLMSWDCYHREVESWNPSLSNDSGESQWMPRDYKLIQLEASQGQVTLTKCVTVWLGFTSDGCCQRRYNVPAVLSAGKTRNRCKHGKIQLASGAAKHIAGAKRGKTRSTG